MNLLHKLRSATVTPPPIQISERDRLNAEIEYEQAGLPELELLVRMGRRTQEDLDAQRGRIAQLQGKLHGLEIEEAEIKRIQDACSTDLPGAEAALAAEVQSFVNDLLRLHAKVRSIHEKRTAMIDRFADFKARQQHGLTKVPLANRELLPLTASRLLEECTDTYGLVANFLKRAREAGFVVPEPVPAKLVPSRNQSTRALNEHRPEKAAPMASQERRVRKITESRK